MALANKGTRSVWSGEGEYLMQGATQVPVSHSVSYGYRDIDEWYEVALGQREGHIYGRNTNPTVDVFEEKMRDLEGAEAAAAFSTGMAAISNTLFTLLSPGDRIVSVKDTYGGTNKIFLEYFPRFQIDVELCDTTDHETIEAEVAKGCKVLYLETPTNPTLKIMDIERLVKAAEKVGAIVIVDNTFATPINQNPLELGATLVVHSATKFIGGHADALAGVVCGPKDIVHDIYHFREIHGAMLDPMSAYFMIRGLKTLELRVEKQQENAMAIAKFLQEQPQVEDVFYPGLEGHEGYDIAKKQMKGYGGMLSFSLTDGLDGVRQFLPQLQYAHLAANLGAVETIASIPRTASHVESTEEERKAMGIPEGLIRYSVGIENVEDLKADIKQALAVLQKTKA